MKPVKAAFSVLARHIDSRQSLYEHTRFSWQELWVIRHLVEPFEKICRNRLPSAGTAHSLMLEESIRGSQYCLDGYCFDGKLVRLGVVDAIMYPGTDAFMRWEYPSQLAEKYQQEAQLIAQRFLNGIGFTHGLFNMEFVVEENTKQIKVIEFNPRLAAQFSDLYARVDGVNLHAIALALAHGNDPQSLSLNKPTAACASSLVYRSFDPDANITMPPPSTVKQLKNKFAVALLLPFPKTPEQIQRDFKWLGSYRYAILHLEGKNPDDLQSRCAQASQILDWPAPYFKHPVFSEDITEGWDDIEDDDYTGDLSSVKT